MKLKYRILWIENEQDWVESIEDQIQEYLEDLGFTYDMKLIGKEEKNVTYNNYDLILMDLNLADQPNGAELISKIRELGTYTDVVFYSSMGIDELRAKGKEKELEGVYYSGRTPETSFINKVKAVIDSTIKKVQDLNNLRGLVMAEVSELDALMEVIIIGYYTNSERLEKLHNKVTKDREKNIHKSLDIPEGESCNKKCTLNIRSKSIEDIARIYDSSQKAHAVHEILKEINVDGNFIADYRSFYTNYDQEIMSVRNDLAHCESKEDKGIEILCTRKGDVTFSTENFKKIRKDIAKYNNLFNDIAKSL